VRLLLDIMSTLDDTNVLHRTHSEQRLRQLQQRAGDLLQAGCDLAAVEQFNRELTADNISPGGSADMLALTLLVDGLTTDITCDITKNRL